MNMTEAMREVKADKVRGVGCARIDMADGRQFNVVDHADTLVERYRYDGKLVERLEAADVTGEVEAITWSCDESGALYC